MNQEMVEAFAASSDRSTAAAARALLGRHLPIPTQVIAPREEALAPARHAAECWCPTCLHRQAFDR